MLHDYNNEALKQPVRQHRCSCGQLMAVVTEAGLEIKCKRCKQVYVINSLPTGAELGFFVGV